MRLEERGERVSVRLVTSTALPGLAGGMPGLRALFTYRYTIPSVQVDLLCIDQIAVRPLFRASGIDCEMRCEACLNVSVKRA